ncbi:hypothetical protein GR183_08180 [Stappia sp. GBMRC 2046]|uniref:Inner membrane protein n=1 Tax=Stappia sediminis TaxID=2692190 RepID=A0A7X3LTP0_9HYPH|nr:hypothetical protein [Stappia sediminis]MXN64883.1 hypothetical protein [Stappia sediminis]
MAADKGKPGKNQGSGPQRSGSYSGGARKPVTIDLEAKEVNKAAAEGKENSKKADEKSSGGASPGPGAKAATSPSATSQSASASASKPGTASASSGKTADTKPDAAKEAAKPAETKAPPSSAATSAASASASAGKDTPKGVGGDKQDKPADAKAADAKTATSSTKPDEKAAAASGVKSGTDTAAKAEDKAKGAPAASALPSPKTEQKAEQKEGVGFGKLIAAGVIGAVLVAGGGYALNRAGVLNLSAQSVSEDMRAALEAAQTRVETLENRIAELAQSASSGGEPSEAMSALQTRVSALEESASSAGSEAGEAVSGEIESLKTGLAELRRFVSSGSAGESAGLAALEKRQQDTAATQGEISSRLDALAPEIETLKALPGQIETLGSTLDEQSKTIASLSQTLNTATEANKQALAGLQESVTALQSDLAEVKSRLEPIESRLGDATARETAARAIAVSSLSSAVDEGRPYETQLAAVKGVLPADTDLSALQEHAAGGIPTRASLTAQFPAVARAMTAALDQPPQDGDLVDSFLSNARSLVSVRTPGESDAATPAAAIGRMEARVGAGDFKGAIAAYGELPENVQAAGADWVAAAKARVAADVLVAKVTDSVLKELAKSGS